MQHRGRPRMGQRGGDGGDGRAALPAHAGPDAEANTGPDSPQATATAPGRCVLRAWWRLCVATIFCASNTWAGAVLAADASAPSPAAAAPPAAAPAAPGHQPLRDNQPPTGPLPAEPETFAGYAGARPFTVVPRQPHLALYPCSQCHKQLPLNPQPRKLVAAPHNAALPHGKGRFWCLDCHQGNDRDVLRTLQGAKVGFNEASQVCGQCHGARQRDWTFGAHGKRVAGWTGERQLYACTHCHDPHQPTLQPRAPLAPPPLRAGLRPMARVPEHAPLPWQHPARKE